MSPVILLGLVGSIVAIALGALMLIREARAVNHQAKFRIEVIREDGEREVWDISPSEITQLVQFLDELDPLGPVDKVRIQQDVVHRPVRTSDSLRPVHAA